MKRMREILYGVSLIEVIGTTDTEISNIVFDSRKVNKKSCFIAIKGTQVDGHEFIDKAILSGSTVIICEFKPEEIKANVNYYVVKNSQSTLSTIASNFYDNPSSKIKLIGITGTNGKTTCTTLLYKLFQELGFKVGLISTVVNIINEQKIPSTHTTPDPLTLNELLSRMVEEGCTYCFMEVSSHAIHQKRIAGLTFAIGAFTNISHDHLDYHKTFKEYIQVKQSFFNQLSETAIAISNADDKNGAVMLQNSKALKKYYALKSIANYKAKVIENTFSGLVLTIDEKELWTSLIGDFNAYNILLVYSIAVELEQDPIEILRIISKLNSVEGRFEYFISGTGIIVIVDYAHTPDALKNVLSTIKNIRTGNEGVTTIIGCGGDRDKTKRPEMAKIACEGSDKVVFTSDNPRSEDPEEIINEMMKGVEGHHFKKTLTITNRKEAIKTACSISVKGDIILVAGKGHETYQEIAGIKYDFDDLEITKDLLIKLNK